MKLRNCLVKSKDKAYDQKATVQGFNHGLAAHFSLHMQKGNRIGFCIINLLGTDVLKFEDEFADKGGSQGGFFH